MTNSIKTNKPWQKHSSYKAHKPYGLYYDELVKKRRSSVKRIIYIIIFILILQSFFQAPFLSLRKVELRGNSFYKDEEVKQYVQTALEEKKWLFFQNNNFFLFKAGSLKDQLIKQYNLSDVSIKKTFPNKLSINFIEKTSQFIWKKNDSYYLMDAKGQLNGQINEINNKYIILADFRSYQPKNNENIFRPDEIELIQGIITLWQEKLANMVKIEAINIGDDWSTFDIKTNLSYIAKINPQDDINAQLENYRRILLEGNVVGTDINYINLRFGEKAYFQ
ncbi:MAG: FtsQ-type POTRA domain-containing protein [Patescibacteria group bacterium]|jgi:cell division septal protein FtsQ